MSHKRLTELEWKKFGRGRGFKDAALIKGLAALERATTPDAVLAALRDIEKQASALGSSQKADKELQAYLTELGQALLKQRAASELELRQVAQLDVADDEADSPALLAAGMLPLLRQVRKGASMCVLLASTGKEVAVLLSRRAIAPTRRKSMTDHLGVGTAKFFAGNCVFEEGAYTFVVETQATGLARKVKAALLKQVGLRVKVRVRGENPADVDDDGESAEPDDGSDASTTAPSPPEAVDPPVSEDARRDDPSKAFKLRLAAMLPLIKARIQAMARPDDAVLKQMALQAGASAMKNDFANASAVLDRIDFQLSKAGAVQPGDGTIPIAALDRTRAEWNGARLHAVSELDRLKKILMAEYDGEDAQQAALTRALGRLDAVIDALSDELDIRLGAMLGADAMRWPGAAMAARPVLDRLQRLVESDPVLKDVDGNEYAPDMRIAAPLRERLVEIRAALDAGVRTTF